MREYLLSVISHLNENGWNVDRDYCLWLFDNIFIMAFFAENETQTMFFTIKNGEFSYLIFNKFNHT